MRFDAVSVAAFEMECMRACEAGHYNEAGYLPHLSDLKAAVEMTKDLAGSEALFQRLFVAGQVREGNL